MELKTLRSGRQNSDGKKSRERRNGIGKGKRDELRKFGGARKGERVVMRRVTLREEKRMK